VRAGSSSEGITREVLWQQQRNLIMTSRLLAEILMLTVALPSGSGTRESMRQLSAAEASLHSRALYRTPVAVE